MERRMCLAAALLVFCLLLSALPAAAGKSGVGDEEAKPLTGTLIVKTSPIGVEVSIDGKPVSIPTPFKKQLPAGEHTLKFTYQGQSFQQVVDVPEDETLTVKVDVAAELARTGNVKNTLAAAPSSMKSSANSLSGPEWLKKGDEAKRAGDYMGAASAYVRSQQWGYEPSRGRLRDLCQDEVSRIAIFQQAQAGDPDCQYLRGRALNLGQGVAKDGSEAVSWYRKAADQGHPNATNNLAKCYQDGEGVARDHQEAIRLFRKAVELGSSDAANNLGRIYQGAIGIVKDNAEAAKWFRKAAEQGNAIAQNNLGDMYYAGKGVTQDYAEAVKWFRKAAEQGNTTAQNNLGFMYDNGNGVAKDLAEAANWYRKAAEQGDATAQNNLGIMYYYSKGVAQDYEEAVKWFRKAAEQGNTTAQHNLGIMYANGQGVEQDYTRSYMWYSVASDAENKDVAVMAVKNRDALAGKMNSSQLEKGRCLVREWFDAKARKTNMAHIEDQENLDGEDEDNLEGTVAPEIMVEDWNGNLNALSELYKNKTICICFWGLLYNDFNSEMFQVLEDLSTKYAANGLLVLGVNCDGVTGELIKEKFAKREDLRDLKITFPIVLDQRLEWADSFKISGIPQFVLIDHEGIIRFYGGGFHFADGVKLEKIVKKFLPKQAAQPVTAARTAAGGASVGVAGTYTDPVTGMEFVWVEGGCFQMGSDSGDPLERPTHRVCVDGYYIGKYEVTQAQWAKVIGSNPSIFKGDDRPVHNVSWNDVQDYIRGLNIRTGKNYRLPTEAEWEYAARGGKESRGYKYSGSNDVNEVAWYWGNSDDHNTHPVGQKKANELGIYDMSGNASEWVGDWYGNYSAGEQRNPTGPTTGSYRVYRGGGFLSIPGFLLSTHRFGEYPGDLDDDFSFRLLLQM